MNVRLILLVALLSVSSAASAKKFAPPMPLAQNLQVEVILNQQELAVDVPDTANQVGAQFGLIGALIGAAVTAGQVANAEKVVEDIRNQLVDYNFNATFERQLREKLASEGLSPNPQFTFMASPWDAYSAKKAGKVAANGILVITPRYSITNNFELLKVNMTVTSVNRTFKSNGKPKEKIVFWRNYSFQYPMSKIKGSFAAEDSQRWVGMGKAELHGLLEQGSSQVIDMLVYEFSPAGRAQLAEKTKAKNTYLNGKAYWGWNLRQDPKWIWVREYKVAGITGYYPLTGESTTAAAPAAVVAPEAAAPAAMAAPEAAAAPAPVLAPEAVPAPAAAVAAPVTGAESH